MKTEVLIHDLELLTFAGLRISQNTQGRSPVPWATMMVSLIFSRLVLNAISVLRLTPGSSFCHPVGTMQIWDLSGVASLSRNLVEASFTLHYMSEHLVNSDAELRELVWRYHEASERYKMLKDALPQSPGVPVLQQRTSELRSKVASHPAFQVLPEGKRKKRILHAEMAKLRSNEEICLATGVDCGYYNSMFKYGSNHTHSSPFSFTEMDGFNAKDEQAREEGVFWAALQTSAGFLSLALLDFLRLFPDQDKEISSKERFRLLFWEQVLKRGPASLVPKPNQ